MTRHFFVVVRDRGKLKYLGIGNIASYRKGVISIGTRFTRTMERKAKGGVTEEQVAAVILNHEAVHWVLDKFIGESEKTRLSLWTRFLNLFADKPFISLNASYALDVVFDGDHHDMEMGL